MQRLVLVPSAKGKLPHLIHSLTQGPAQPRGTGFAEQAAIQYFVFPSLFNTWPQAKPCSEYRTGGFLAGFSTGSSRAAARQFTSTFTVKHPCLPNWKLRNREIRVAGSHSSECLYEDPQGSGFLGHFKCSKHSSHWCPLWLCSLVPRLMSWKKITIWGIDYLGVSYDRLDWKGLAECTQDCWQGPEVKRVLQCAIHCSICLPSNFCDKWANTLQKPSPSLPSPQLTTSEGAHAHRSDTKADCVHFKRYLSHFSRETLAYLPWTYSSQHLLWFRSWPGRFSQVRKKYILCFHQGKIPVYDSWCKGVWASCGQILASFFNTLTKPCFTWPGDEKCQMASPRYLQAPQWRKKSMVQNEDCKIQALPHTNVRCALSPRSLPSATWEGQPPYKIIITRPFKAKWII